MWLQKVSCIRQVTLKGFITMLSLLKWNVGHCKKLGTAKSWDRKNLFVQLAPFFVLYGECPFDDQSSRPTWEGVDTFFWNRVQDSLKNDNQENELQKRDLKTVVFFLPLLKEKKNTTKHQKIVFLSTVVYKYWRAEIAITFVSEDPSIWYAVFHWTTFTPNLVSSHHGW